LIIFLLYMPFALYDYCDQKGNKIAEWGRGQPKSQLAKLNAKLDAIANAAPDLVDALLAGVNGYPHLRKIKIHGNPQLRPLLCKGPINNENEFTLLCGTREIQSKLQPSASLAEERRLALKEDATKRCPHERFKSDPL
jgi:hypothetical protein